MTSRPQRSPYRWRSNAPTTGSIGCWAAWVTATWITRLAWVFSRPAALLAALPTLLLMGWEMPKTWTVDELVTAGDLNQHIRNNMNALKNPPSAHFEPNQGSDYTTSQTSFVDVDATNLALTITTNGGDVFLHFHGTINATAIVYFDVYENNARLGGDDGFLREQSTGVDRTISFTRLISGLAGSILSGCNGGSTAARPRSTRVRAPSTRICILSSGHGR